MALMTAINFLGVKKLADTNSAMTWWKVGVPLLTIFVLAVTNFHTSNFTAAERVQPGRRARRPRGGRRPAASSSATSASSRPTSSPARAANPKRDIPLAIIGSIVIGIVIYIALQVVFLAALPPCADRRHLGPGRQRPLHRPSPARSPRSRRWSASAGSRRSSTSTRSSRPAGTGLIYTTGSSRVSYGLRRNGYVPTAFEWTNARGVPWVGLIAAFVAGCICFLPFPSWQSLVGLITSASVLMYAGAPLSLGVFRRTAARRRSALSTAGGAAPLPRRLRRVQPASSCGRPGRRIWKLGVAILIGYAILVVNRLFKLNDRASHISSCVQLRGCRSTWSGWASSSRLSTFGGTGDLKLWWDMLVVAIFSLIIYYWALAVALPTEEIKRDDRGGRHPGGGGPGGDGPLGRIEVRFEVRSGADRRPTGPEKWRTRPLLTGDTATTGCT